MKYMLENDKGKVIFTCGQEIYELRSHPYEPCLYICKDNEIVKVLHNAFETDCLPAIFEAGETVQDPCGRRYDKDEFCAVLAAALRDKHYEMNFTFAAAEKEKI